MAGPGFVLSQIPGYGRPGKVKFENLPQVEKIIVAGDQTTFIWRAGIEITMRRTRDVGRPGSFSGGKIYFLRVKRGDQTLALFDRGTLSVAPAQGTVEEMIFARVVSSFNR
jgi:hypothetical protein